MDRISTDVLPIGLRLAPYDERPRLYDYFTIHLAPLDPAFTRNHDPGRRPLRPIVRQHVPTRPDGIPVRGIACGLSISAIPHAIPGEKLDSQQIRHESPPRPSLAQTLVGQPTSLGPGEQHLKLPGGGRRSATADRSNTAGRRSIVGRFGQWRASREDEHPARLNLPRTAGSGVGLKAVWKRLLEPQCDPSPHKALAVDRVDDDFDQLPADVHGGHGTATPHLCAILRARTRKS
jgi:hypothetical protein